MTKANAKLLVFKNYRLMFFALIITGIFFMFANINNARAIEREFIRIKAEMIDAGDGKQLWNFFATDNGGFDEFNVTATSYAPFDCGILLTQEVTGNNDEDNIIWVKKGRKLTFTGNLKSNLGNPGFDYVNCCGGGIPPCDMDGGGNCSANVIVNPAYIFQANYGAVDDNECGTQNIAAPCNSNANTCCSESATTSYYAPKHEMLCADSGKWAICDNDAACASDGTNNYACNDSGLGGLFVYRGQWDLCAGTCTGGACDVSGLSLSASASPSTIALGGSSTITFKVTDGSGSDVNGATVSGISVSAGGGSVSANACITIAGGECTVTYDAPAASTVATVTATKAAKAGETDSGLANVNVTVSSCTVNTAVKFGDDSYDVGDPLNIQWKVGALEPSNDYIVCIYDEDGNDVWEKNIAHFEGGANLGNESPKTADAAGTWTASLSIGFSCPDPPDGCIDSATVSEVGCNNNGVQDNGETGVDCGGGGCPACGGGGGCNNNGVQDNGETGVDCGGGGCPACGGGGGGDSACDPDAWYFCNPLRGSVETFVQAGETMLGYILGLIGSIALLFIIIAGAMYMTSAGNEERISSSKRILSGAVIGLMIALLAYGLLHVIMTVLGM